MDYGSGSEDFILQKVSAKHWGQGGGKGAPVTCRHFAGRVYVQSPQPLGSFPVTNELDVRVRRL